MNRSQIRDMMMALRARSVPSTDTTTINTYNSLIDMAYKRLATECPAALMPDVEHVVLYPEYTSKSTSVKLTDTSDPYVFEITPVNVFNTKVDGTWDGIYHLEITDKKGQKQRRQCREFFNSTDLLGNIIAQYVSVDRPWQTILTGPYDFRLYAPEFFVTDDVIQVLDAGIWDPTRGVMLPLSEGYVNMTQQQDIQADTLGRPINVYRSRHFQLDAPNRAPTTSLNAQQQAVWGLEATGTFDYCYTYVWGRKDPERQDPAGNPDPMWESSPSPVSSTVTVPASRLAVVDVTLPDIDWQIKFDVAATLRQGHSGLRKRIYRRRYTATGAAPLVTSIESPEVFQFMAEVDGTTTTWTDDGSVIPGYYRRLPEVHGYYAWRALPQQDQRYEVDIRVLRRPRDLKNEYDAPRIQPDAIDALVQWAVYYFDSNDANPAGAATALAEAKRLTALYQQKYAAPASYVEAIPWDGVSRRPNTHWIGRARI